MQELIGLLVVFIVWACAACESPILRVGLCVLSVALFVGVSANATRSAFVSARQAAADRSLPQTSNPRFVAKKTPTDPVKINTARPSIAIAATPRQRTKAPVENNTSTANLNNEESADATDVDVPALASINHFAYTPAGQQARRDEWIFRPEPRGQTSDERARLLASMYEELLESSQKRDPGMRPAGGNGCAPLRGRAMARVY